MKYYTECMENESWAVCKDGKVIVFDLIKCDAEAVCEELNKQQKIIDELLHLPVASTEINRINCRCGLPEKTHVIVPLYELKDIRENLSVINGCYVFDKAEINKDRFTVDFDNIGRIDTEEIINEIDKWLE